uniref:SLAM family member 9 n=1 Tax=Crocodylus porosus TaxID=8502 RepID=A0A7M4F4T8_CROPO
THLQPWLVPPLPLLQGFAQFRGASPRGDEVTFALEIPAGEMLDNVGWTIGTKSLAIVEAGAPPRVVVSQRRYRGRLRVPTDGLSLLIAALSPEDAGSYTAIIHTDKSQFTRIFTLRVYERLPQPRIRCDAQSCANGLCNTTLSCTIPSGGSNVTYSWSPPQPSSTTPQGSTAVIPHPDPLINVTCTAHNPVSNNSTTASVKALCGSSILRGPPPLTSCRQDISARAPTPLPLCSHVGRLVLLALERSTGMKELFASPLGPEAKGPGHQEPG